MIWGRYEISREEIMETAETYKNHRWIATESNIYHDSPEPQPRTDDVPEEPLETMQLRELDGPVDTPDRETYTDWSSWKGWAIGENVGIPYKWLGWRSIEEFDHGITDGRYAGDVNFAEGNDKAVGVDCAGFVSRCWRLSYDHTTKMLYGISQPIKFEDLKEGDILDSYGQHVMLFKEFLTPEKAVVGVTRIMVTEATSYDWKVNEWEYLLVEISDITEEWIGFKYATSSVTLELVSSMGLSRITGPYVIRTRSATALYLTNLIPRHRYWFVIFLTTSIIVGFIASYIVVKKGKEQNYTV
jgi:hypothetical protein